MKSSRESSSPLCWSLVVSALFIVLTKCCVSCNEDKLSKDDKYITLCNYLDKVYNETNFNVSQDVYEDFTLLSATAYYSSNHTPTSVPLNYSECALIPILKQKTNTSSCLLLINVSFSIAGHDDHDYDDLYDDYYYFSNHRTKPTPTKPTPTKPTPSRIHSPDAYMHTVDSEFNGTMKYVEIGFNSGGCHNVTVTMYGSLDDTQSVIDFDKQSSNSQSPLKIDEALLRIENHLPFPVTYSELSANCYKCLFKELGVIYPGQTVSVAVSTTFKMTYSFNSSADVIVCSQIDFHFKEHYHYSYKIGSKVRDQSNNTYCKLETCKNELENSNMPILYVGIILIGSFLIWTIGIKVYTMLNRRGLLHFRKLDRQLSKDIGDPEIIQKEYGAVNKSERDQLLNSSTERDNGGSVQTQSTAAPGKKQRLKSLDTVRGLSLIIMIFVNYGGGGYWFLSHSKWNGVTVADLVFPWFVWIMGVSIVFSFRGRKKDSFKSQLYQVIRRTVILMSLGLFLNNEVLAVPWFLWELGLSVIVPLVGGASTSSALYKYYKASIIVLWVGLWACFGFELSKWRIPGVLQRFAVSYFVVAMTELFTVRLYSSFGSRIMRLKILHDIIFNSVQWVLILVLEAIWLAFTFGLNVPGCPRGYLGPGGLSESGKYPNCTGGAAGYIDHWLLSDSHIYRHPTCKELYQTGPYDPEGILGSLNSIVICFLGVQAGRIITYHRGHYSRLIRFIIWGILLGGIATILCEGQKNEGFIPLNKNLWSLSFILLMAGMAFILLSVFYFLIDVIEVWNGAPFIYPGMNSILVYVGSELLEGMFPFGWQGMENSHLTFLISNVISVSLWSLIAYYWYWIQFFVKI